jgi:hypothetical protein
MKKSKWVERIIACSLVAFYFALGVFFLIKEFLSGSEFVAYIALGVISALAGYFNTRLVEFSLAGNVIKLREETESLELRVEKAKSSLSLVVKTQFNQFGRMYDASYEKSLFDAKVFLEYYNLYKEFELSEEIDFIDSVAESVTRQYLYDTTLYIPALQYIGSENNEAIPTPEFLYLRNKGKVDTVLYPFYRDELYPVIKELRIKNMMY